MLKYDELVAEVKQLDAKGKLALLELISHFLRDELIPANKSSRTSASSVERVRGMAKPDSILPDNFDWKESYTDYLVEKYK